MSVEHGEDPIFGGNVSAAVCEDPQRLRSILSALRTHLLVVRAARGDDPWCLEQVRKMLFLIATAGLTPDSVALAARQLNAQPTSVVTVDIAPITLPADALARLKLTL